MFTGVSIICFAASYLVALVLEITRLFFRASMRMVSIVAFAVAGLIAHTIYLTMQAQVGMTSRGAPLSNWYHWCLIASWLLVMVYITLALSRPRNTMGLFLLPMVLALVGAAQFFPEDQSFPIDQAHRAWSMIHGMALLLGTTAVFFGFAAGLMYLLQSNRLKRKLPPRRGFLLPSLEWLDRTTETSLLVSSFLLVAGLVSGIVLNLIKHGSQQNHALPWTDPVVWTSGVLLIWVIATLLFTSLYKPARHGRKVAYLTVGSFVFLVLVLGIVVSGQTEHATSAASDCLLPADVATQWPRVGATA